MTITLVHERMLLGAIDSFLSTVVHVRPYLAASYRDHLERFADYWLEEGNLNELDSVDPDAIMFYLSTLENPAPAEAVLKEFYRWAEREGLIDNDLTIVIP